MPSYSIFPRNNGRGLPLRIIAAVSGIAIAATAAPTRAETVFDAMRDAFTHNPAIAAESERLQATRQSIPAAQAGFLPTISASADIGLQQAEYAIAAGQNVRQRPYGWSATIEQPLYDGGAALATVRRGTANTKAGQQTLLTTKSAVLLAAVTVFADLRRNAAVVSLQTESVTALAAVLQQTRERRAAQDATIADASQSEVALASAQLQLAQANAALVQAQAQFLEVVGRPARSLDGNASQHTALPERLETALHHADTQHPAIIAAQEQVEAARQAIDIAMAKYLPTVALQASYQSHRDLDGYIPATTQTQGARIEAVARIPLYTGGSVDAEVRAARHTHLSLLHELARTRAAVRTGVVSAWTARTQSKQAVLLLARQIEAGKHALDALRKGQSAGERTLTDVLGAERDLVASRVLLAQARRDALVTQFALLASIGELSAPPADEEARGAIRSISPPKSAAPLRWTTVVQPTSSRLVTHK